MNEQIKEIWHKAAASFSKEDSSWKTQQNFLNRFAELVVQECLDIGMSRISGYALYDYEKEKEATIAYREQIKKHFGVE